MMNLKSSPDPPIFMEFETDRHSLQLAHDQDSL